MAEEEVAMRNDGRSLKIEEVEDRNHDIDVVVGSGFRILRDVENELRGFILVAKGSWSLIRRHSCRSRSWTQNAMRIGIQSSWVHEGETQQDDKQHDSSRGRSMRSLSGSDPGSGWEHIAERLDIFMSILQSGNI